MFKAKCLISREPIRNWIILGVPVLFILGSLMHFVYDWSGNLAIVGVFAPINESVWEHLKMTFWPVLIWWIIGYIILRKKNEVSFSRWFISCTIALLVCPLVIVAFHYGYTGALGIESLILDIFSLFLALSAAQGLALHVYRHSKPNRYYLYICFGVIVLLAAAFTVFTFIPPHIPLFMD